PCSVSGKSSSGRTMHFHQTALVWAILATTVGISADNSDEQKAVAKLELLGGKVVREDATPGSPVIEVTFEQNNRFGDPHVRLLKQLRSLRTLSLAGTRITDVGMKDVGQLRGLTKLNLNSTKITAAGLKEIQTLHTLTGRAPPLT